MCPFRREVRRDCAARRKKPNALAAMPFSYTRRAIPQGGHPPGSSSRFHSRAASHPLLRPQVASSHPLGEASHQNRFHQSGGSLPTVARTLLSQSPRRVGSDTSPMDAALALQRGQSLIDLRRNMLELPDRAVTAAMDADTTRTLEKLAPESLAMTSAYVAVAKRRPKSAAERFDRLWDEAWPWQQEELFRLMRVDEVNTQTAKARHATAKRLAQQLEHQMSAGNLALARRKRELLREQQRRSSRNLSSGSSASGAGGSPRRQRSPGRSSPASTTSMSPPPTRERTTADGAPASASPAPPTPSTSDAPDTALAAARIARPPLPPYGIAPRGETRFSRRAKALGGAVVGSTAWWRAVRGDYFDDDEEAEAA